MTSEVKKLNLEKKENRVGEFPKQTLAAKVPALQCRELWISESLAILEYLEETYSSSETKKIFPKNPDQRAKDREILLWLRTDLFELQRCMPYEGMFVSVEKPTVTQRAISEVQQLTEVTKRRLSQKRNTLTVADFELAFTLRRPLFYEPGLLADFADVVHFSDSVWNRPSVQSWVTENRK